MATFINKKERVFDIELTSYGKYLLSVGKFKPSYYAFYDDNIIYDKQYAHSTATENQNDIDNRVKDTQYIESLVLFRDVEETLNNGEGASDWYSQTVITSRQQTPTKDVFKMDAPIGDATIEGNTNKSPAWKIVGLQGKIDSVTETDATNNSIVPQINITAMYNKKVVESDVSLLSNAIVNNVIRTATFEDGKQIILDLNDPMYYVEETNTPIFVNNFDIEIFEVLTSSNDGAYEQLSRKNFKSKPKQIVNGFMVADRIEETQKEITTNDVEYYFDVLVDQDIDQKIACKAAIYFNKKSYYVDLDFECEKEEEEGVFYDIYGTSTEPEICQD
tara:strand:- start:34 stop:1029 length:996 start_codon:yes stop_codon:yes gene_type:complete